MARAARAFGVCLVLGIACACSSAEQDTCASGLTKVCLSDGTTCTCSPSCTPPDGCLAHKICRKGTCAQCSNQTCICSSNTCIPGSWSPGDTVTFQ